jgi:hypothetical protein
MTFDPNPEQQLAIDARETLFLSSAKYLAGTIMAFPAWVAHGFLHPARPMLLLRKWRTASTYDAKVPVQYRGVNMIRGTAAK